MMGSGPGMMMRLSRDSVDSTVTRQRIRKGIVRRIIPYTRPYRGRLMILLIFTSIDAAVVAANPLILRAIIDDGILPRRVGVVVSLSLAVGGLAVADALAQWAQSWMSGRVGQGLVFDLRTEVFKQVQRQPLAFFTRAQTGSLVSRLNTDVIGAQQAITMLLTQLVSAVLTLALVLAAMFYLSWQVGVASVVVLPLFVLPGRVIGRRLQRYTRESMQLDAELGSLMNERFNVAGAILTKLYGRPDRESRLFTDRAGRVRDIGVITGVYARMMFVILGLVASLATALVYGLGGDLVIRNLLQIGSLVALAALLTRLYGPINQISSMQANVLTALVSFDRVFEVLDLKPLVAERPGALALPPPASVGGRTPEIEFDNVSFRYPAAKDVSLASLESVSLPMPERTEDAAVLREVSFAVPAGTLTALVGPSGAGKTTITHLVPRLYDPTSGTVRIRGCDLRDLTLQSVEDAIGVVTQDAHLFHDTIRGNLSYARVEATEKDLIQACKGAQIWDLISRLPNGLDTVVGDRGYRLSGGEKQRIALARLLLKAPSIVVLDEATAHLDSESEAAVQRALKTALAGRTSLVIAHRLSTIREADQILVLDEGQIRERGTHAELLEAGGLYAELYLTQFAGQATADDHEPQPASLPWHPAPAGSPVPSGYPDPPVGGPVFKTLKRKMGPGF
jgi:ATP-binding cassette, subfamily B, bacterial